MLRSYFFFNEMPMLLNLQNAVKAGVFQSSCACGWEIFLLEPSCTVKNVLKSAALGKIPCSVFYEEWPQAQILLGPISYSNWGRKDIWAKIWPKCFSVALGFKIEILMKPDVHGFVIQSSLPLFFALPHEILNLLCSFKQVWWRISHCKNNLNTYENQ